MGGTAFRDYRRKLAMGASYGNVRLPAFLQRFVLNIDRSYPGLPRLFVLSDGTPVRTAADYAGKRAEMLEDCSRAWFGAIPRDGFETSFEVLERETVLQGAEHTKVKITVTTPLGSHETLMDVYEPASQSHGMFAGLTFSREGLDGWPLDLILMRGYGLAVMSYGDWEEDRPDAEGRLRDLFAGDGREYTAFSSWAFGIHRAVDYLETLPRVNKSRIGSIGLSRLARVSLWAAANDPRIRLAGACCPGGLLRCGLGDLIAERDERPHWHTAAWASYEEHESDFPVDMHTLFALIADRSLFVIFGRTDLANDPVSVLDSLELASKVWRDIYGRTVPGTFDFTRVPVDVPVINPSVGFLLHSGGHAFTEEDWLALMTQMDRL